MLSFKPKALLRFGYYVYASLMVLGASLVAQLVKNPPTMRETWVRFLGLEDPLEKGKATHSVSWPGEFHGWYRPWGCKESRHDWATFTTWVRSLGQEDRLENRMLPTPVFLPGEFHEQRSLAGYSQDGCKELETTETNIHINTLWLQ